MLGSPLHSRPPLPDKDGALDDHELRAARALATTGYWLPAQTVIAAAGTGWERRGHRITVLGEAAADGGGGWLDEWLAAAPDDPTAITLNAATLSLRASKARGSASAAGTTREQFLRFDELSAAAQVQAQRAVAVDRADPAPCTILCRTMYSRGDGDGFHAALAEGRRRDPFDFDLNARAVDFHCAKWFGSHDTMFAIARGTADAAPPGVGVTMLPLLAHLEYAMREFSWGRVTDRTVKDSRAYFQRPDVQQEVDACVAKWHAAGPPAHPKAVLCDNWLAIVYALGSRRRECRAVFRRIGPYAATHLWTCFFGSQAGGFLANWRWANSIG
ncbi:hypothetical protein OHA72_31750 [Dactylosporangium sp. NBC_01737]|uniref:hypothetical protein n=1 Tax=Dactylosporangium sp. NBC_01737 TaxID=2975959 RepID=UPI002E14B544|nr:hypothetical protein OHA72_31750 [Dactylosporangium sp. NBC_01737]